MLYVLFFLKKKNIFFVISYICCCTFLQWVFLILSEDIYLTKNVRGKACLKPCVQAVGFDMAKTAAERLYRKTGVKPTDVDVVELHDCFSANELITYEALGLCQLGKAGEMIDRGGTV